ncbi:hypothetical protein SAMN05660472_01036 [Natronincola ferrireducens]|uniref:Uncharacterized protein n=1 Tax=Natronincola ferrireducens TaxID=393762 RepID=A0A1G9A1V6_9FIRM|nr:hypothetical protein SAMN05660472_01036 [Natronincola ferrireducens]
MICLKNIVNNTTKISKEGMDSILLANNKAISTIIEEVKNGVGLSYL